MSEQELQNLQELVDLECEARYDYCLSQVMDEKEIWILVNSESHFLKIFSEDGDFEYLPIWPSAELAQRYAKDSPELTPKCISLPEFLKKWVSGLQKDGLELGVFPGADATVWITDADTFKQELQDQLSNFF